VNDIHSKLNSTFVREIVRPDSLEELRSAVRRAEAENIAISVTGARHAMGGQQFGTNAILLDMSGLYRVLSFDTEKGLVEVQAGIDWVDLVNYLITVQRGGEKQWGIVQKQTGADRLSLGGAVSANIHGRGLKYKPLVQDIESVTIVNADADLVTCSRDRNAELFRLVVGGYGLFGVVYSVSLRLQERHKVERIVRMLDLDDFLPAVEERIAEGCLYGDLQLVIDDKSPDFLTHGIFSCYRPVPSDTPIPPNQRYIPQHELEHLIYLAHVDKAEGFRRYAEYYTASSGQIYYNDTHQFGFYPYDYHREIDRIMATPAPGSEMITELYVPRSALGDFMRDVAYSLRRHDDDVIYSTIRLIERDEETFLAWARQAYACVIFNVHVTHSPIGIDRAAVTLRRLIDLAARLDGSYYLTYHRFATRDQVLACYPQFPEFLELKRRYDPRDRFQSDWYRHHCMLLD